MRLQQSRILIAGTTPFHLIDRPNDPNQTRKLPFLPGVMPQPLKSRLSQKLSLKEPSDANTDDPNLAFTSASPSILSDSPRELLDTSTVGRTPTTTTVQDGDGLQSAKPIPIAKQVRYPNDHFHHQALLFEEPLLERNGMRLPPAKQLIKSSASFFGRGYLFPARLVLRHHLRCETSVDWEESEAQFATAGCDCEAIGN